MVENPNRRTVLKGAGIAISGASFGIPALSENAHAASGFSAVQTPTSKSINAVASTALGPCAVGNSGEVMVRTASGWELVLEKGVTGNGKSILDVAVSDDGEEIWFCGGGGRVGSYNVISGEAKNHSKPQGVSNSWNSIDVIGDARREAIALGNSSGQFIKGKNNCCSDSVNWYPIQKPTGSAIYGVKISSYYSAQIIGPSGSVWENPPSESTWSKVGISSLGVSLNSLSHPRTDESLVGGNSGKVAYDSGSGWSTSTISSNSINGVQIDETRKLAVDSGGKVHENTSGNWAAEDISTTSLSDIEAGDSRTPDTVASKGQIYESGSFDGGREHLVCQAALGTPVEYELHIQGNVQVGDVENSSRSLATCQNHSNCTVINSRVAHTEVKRDNYQMSGQILDLQITTGSANNLSVAISGSQIDERRLASKTWTQRDSPTENNLHSVTDSAAGQYAVGGSGNVLSRTNGSWGLELKSGPGSNGNNLYTVESTDSGNAVWFGGSSGALGRYDVNTKDLIDLSQPKDSTSTFVSSAVSGSAGSEFVMLGNTSGQIVTGTFSSGQIQWNDPITPGTGSSIKGIGFRDATTALFCDSNGEVYRTDDKGSTWNSIGIGYAPGTPQSIDVSTSSKPLVAAGSGFYYSKSSENWVPRYAEGKTLYGIDRSGQYGVMVGKGGQLINRGHRDWELGGQFDSVIFQDVLVTQDDDTVATAVGSSGMIVEQQFSTGMY